MPRQSKLDAIDISVREFPRQVERALSDQDGDPVLGKLWSLGVQAAGGEAPDQADDAIRQPEQQGTGIEGDCAGSKTATMRRFWTSVNSNSVALRSVGIGEIDPDQDVRI